MLGYIYGIQKLGKWQTGLKKCLAFRWGWVWSVGRIDFFHSNSKESKVGVLWDLCWSDTIYGFWWRWGFRIYGPGHLRPRGVDEDGCGLGCVGGLRGGWCQKWGRRSLLRKTLRSRLKTGAGPKSHPHSCSEKLPSNVKSQKRSKIDQSIKESASKSMKIHDLGEWSPCWRRLQLRCKVVDNWCTPISCLDRKGKVSGLKI